MKIEHQKKILALKKQCNEFYEKISFEFDNLCNDPDFGFSESSKLSHVAARFDLFMNDFNEFKL